MGFEDLKETRRSAERSEATVSAWFKSGRPHSKLKASTA